jgi:hypothetical protein
MMQRTCRPSRQVSRSFARRVLDLSPYKCFNVPDHYGPNFPCLSPWMMWKRWTRQHSVNVRTRLDEWSSALSTSLKFFENDLLLAWRKLAPLVPKFLGLALIARALSHPLDEFGTS